MDEMAANVDVIVFHKDKLVPELRIVHQLGYLLQNALAGFVARMCLACKHELQRTFGIIDKRREFLHLRENQIGSLVSREAARKTDSQCIGAEYTAEPLQCFGGFTAAVSLLHRAATDILDEAGFQAEVRFPQFAVVNILDPLPDMHVGAASLPSGPEMAII